MTEKYVQLAVVVNNKGGIGDVELSYSLGLTQEDVAVVLKTGLDGILDDMKGSA